MRIISLVMLAIAILLIGLERPALAEPTEGAKIFSANCASCHAGGGNIIISNKTLKKPALEKYNMLSVEAVISQLQNGKNAMPSFKGRLSEQEIEDVAAFVIQKAENGW